MIEFKNVSKVVGNKIILNNMSLKIEKGELVTLIGPSGCGKTTTLKMINKLIKVSSGEILIDNKNIEGEDTIKLRRNMGYVIQQTGLLPHLTVKENIELIPSLEKIDAEKINNRTIELLKMVDMNPDEYLNKYPNELSGGQQQRIGIARAFAMDPEVILMDEPFSALDPVTRNQLQDEVFNIQQNIKKTIVFVTHDMDEALKLADRICIIENGSVIQYDIPENILKNPANDFVKNFIGEDRIWSQPEFIKARDIMIKSPIKASAERTLLQGIEIMKANHVDSLLIVDKENILNGIITLKEIRATPNKNIKLKDIMERELITAYEDDSIVDVIEKIEKENVSYIPITDKKSKLLGLITKSSLLSVLSSQLLSKEVEE
ncbi:osmoprotectant transport system ATP-binding protein [Clostridium acidisoli DSM 12555]|uniref:Quaternary amine transport ATP-binding protein n=1 Tax=Clostridium acidisoli DSM 12555 TaxID=1121291 RepID=A0A1W1XUN5_9CLOT|nr:ABC transporter ATP-binding protein [Clostridium acidisoli]SMC27669.1 osmoprotectant transport system ATP-binding protein [Clostridium acidisoli DSM 12555]